MNYFAIAPVVLVASFATPSSARQIGGFKDWSAHTEGKGKAQTCWMYS